MKDKLNNIKIKIQELRKKMEDSSNENEIRSYSEEIFTLEEERNQLLDTIDEEIQNEAKRKAEQIVQEKREHEVNQQLEEREKKIIGSFTNKKEEKREGATHMNEELRKKIEEKAIQLRNGNEVIFTADEVRAITTESTGVVLPQHQANEITSNPFPQYSALVDYVNHDILEGGESYKEPFEKDCSEATYTDEGTESADTDPEFDEVEINKSKMTVYTQLSEEVVTLPHIDYVASVMNSLKKAMKRKKGKQMIVGTGEKNTICGIYNAPKNVMPVSCDIEISEIDADTLDKVVLNYGGSEAIEGQATLILSKEDLADFCAVKLTDGKKAYKIEGDGTTGYISSEGSFKVPYVINSEIKPFKKATVGDYTFVYGKLSSYKISDFTSLTIKTSEHYKFREGQVCYRGVQFVGGNVTGYCGFARVKKAEANTASVVEG